MFFEWDEQKNVLNQIKHGVCFEEATTIWGDIHVENAGIAHTNRGESRNATLGLIEKKVYVVIWTNRNNKIRLISVRRAGKNEQKIYYKKIQNSQ